MILKFNKEVKTEDRKAYYMTTVPVVSYVATPEDDVILENNND